MDAGAHGFDDFASETVVIGILRGVIECNGGEEDGQALDGLGATGPLCGGKLEGVDYGRGKGACAGCTV